MASWPAAWRTWVRNAAAWKAKAQPVRNDLLSMEGTAFGRQELYGEILDKHGIFSFGATARGAVRGLSAFGVSDVSVLTQRPVIDALEAAVRRGVKLRLYLDADQRDPQDGEPRERLAALLRMPGVETRFKATSRDIMHFKAYQVDGRFLRTGSANFSFSGSRRQESP
jgi:hypothetical protein